MFPGNTILIFLRNHIILSSMQATSLYDLLINIVLMTICITFNQIGEKMYVNETMSEDRKMKTWDEKVISHECTVRSDFAISNNILHTLQY